MEIIIPSEPTPEHIQIARTWTPEQRAERIRAIVNELDGLKYKPLGHNIAKLEPPLRYELAVLEAANLDTFEVAASREEAA